MSLQANLHHITNADGAALADAVPWATKDYGSFYVIKLLDGDRNEVNLFFHKPSWQRTPQLDSGLQTC